MIISIRCARGKCVRVFSRHLCMATRWPQNADEFEEEDHDYRRAPGDSPS